MSPSHARHGMNPEIHPRCGTRVRIAAAAFAQLLVALICIANSGHGARWWAFVDEIPHGDKLGHIGLMGTLCLLCNLSFTPQSFRFLPARITRVSFVLFVLISLEELSQAFIPSRNCDALDWIADLAGLFLGQTLATVVRNTRSRQTSRFADC